MRAKKIALPLNIVKVILVIGSLNSFAASKTIFLSIGEQRRLKIPPKQSYSIGNTKVISSSYKSNSLFIKGVSIGFTDISIWQKDKQRSIKVFVLSKREALSRSRRHQELLLAGLDIHISGDTTFAKGEIKTLDNYLLLIQALSEKRKKIVMQIALSQELKKQILQKIYRQSYNHGAKLISCRFQEFLPHCSLSIQKIRQKVLAKQLAIYGVVFVTQHKYINYKVSYRIISIDRAKQQSVDLSINTIDNTIISFLNSAKGAILEGEKFTLKDLDTSATLLGRPESYLLPSIESKIALGGELPFSAATQNGVATVWKFFGIDITHKLSLHSYGAQLEYRLSLSTPAAEGFSTSKGQGALDIKLGEYSKLYELNVEQDNRSNSGIPGVKSIPFLKYFFSRTDKGNSSRNIMVFVKIEGV